MINAPPRISEPRVGGMFKICEKRLILMEICAIWNATWIKITFLTVVVKVAT